MICTCKHLEDSSLPSNSTSRQGLWISYHFDDLATPQQLSTDPMGPTRAFSARWVMSVGAPKSRWDRRSGSLGWLGCCRFMTIHHRISWAPNQMVATCSYIAALHAWELCITKVSQGLSFQRRTCCVLVRNARRARYFQMVSNRIGARWIQLMFIRHNW